APNRPHDLQEKPDAPLEDATPRVVPPVRNGRQKLVNQIPVRRMYLDDVKPRLPRPRRSPRKRLNDGGNLPLRQRSRRLIAVVERHRTGRHNRAPPRRRREWLPPFPRPRRRSFAAGVRELDPRDRPLRAQKPRDPRERFDLFVLPEPEILRTDPPARLDRRRLRHDQPRPSDRATPEVHEMPLVREPVGARILAHRR